MNNPIVDEITQFDAKKFSEGGKNAPLLRVLSESEKIKHSFGLAVLNGMNVRYSHIYAGTVTYATKQKRRVKNRVAKQSRKVNRGR